MGIGVGYEIFHVVYKKEWGHIVLLSKVHLLLGDILSCLLSQKLETWKG